MNKNANYLMNQGFSYEEVFDKIVALINKQTELAKNRQTICPANPRDDGIKI